MRSQLPYYESPEDACRAAVQALGGAKRVGEKLWKHKGVSNASRLLQDCMNESRPEKLEMSQVMMILSMAKDVGCHAPFVWMAAQIGYEVKPIPKAEEADRLATVIEQCTRTLTDALCALERMQGRKGK